MGYRISRDDDWAVREAAAALLGRADPLMPPSSSERAPILLDLGVLHEREGRYEEALHEWQAYRMALEKEEAAPRASASWSASAN